MVTITPPADAIEVVARLRAHEAGGVRVVVVLPTYKRPVHLRTTLASVVGQECSFTFAIVVMDNDAGAEGATVANEVLSEAAQPATVILARHRGNCAAYNAGFATALANYPNATHVQIIDDDEIARPGWLQAMFDRARLHEATCTGAPQIPVFDAGADETMRAHPVFRPPYRQAGPVPILYSSGNVLIATDLLRSHGYPWLDEAFNFLGGGDSDFFSRARTNGATFAWEPDAAVDETTPARRTQMSWLNSRSLRNGSISAAIQRKAARGAGDHLARLFKTAALLALSPYRALALFLKTGSPTMALDPMHVALGRLLMEFGFANEQYRSAGNN